MVWEGLTGCGLTKLHILPSGKTSTSKYWIKEIVDNRSETVNLKAACYRQINKKKAV